MPECAEGTLAWVNEADVLGLPLWEGDRHFLRKLMAGDADVSMTLTYEGDTLVSVE